MKILKPDELATAVVDRSSSDRFEQRIADVNGQLKFAHEKGRATPNAMIQVAPPLHGTLGKERGELGSRLIQLAQESGWAVSTGREFWWFYRKGGRA